MNDNDSNKLLDFMYAVHGALVVLVGWVLKLLYSIQGRISKLEQHNLDKENPHGME